VDQGKVLAVDIQPEMLDLIQQKLEDQDLDNVELVLSQPDSPQLSTRLR
jgi:ubiquinone/menaquinone biosynthesis C-methylase UbiE